MRREFYATTDDRQARAPRARNTICILVICVSLFVNCQSAGQKNAKQSGPAENGNSALVLPAACTDAAKPGVLVASAPGGGYWRAERMQGSETKGGDGTSVYYSPVSYPCAWTHLTDLPGIHFGELEFIDAKEGWASVQFLPNLDQGLYRTEDGGKHWTLSTRFSDHDHPREFIETFLWLSSRNIESRHPAVITSFIQAPIGYPPDYDALAIKSYEVTNTEHDNDKCIATVVFEVIGYLREGVCEAGGGTYEEKYTLEYKDGRWKITWATSAEGFTYDRYLYNCKGVF